VPRLRIPRDGVQKRSPGTSATWNLESEQQHTELGILLQRPLELQERYMRGRHHWRTLRDVRHGESVGQHRSVQVRSVQRHVLVLGEHAGLRGASLRANLPHRLRIAQEHHEAIVDQVPTQNEVHMDRAR
jgi:hypothetical protein